MDMKTTNYSENNLVTLQLKFNLAVITKLSLQSDSLSLTDTMLHALLAVPAITSVSIYEVHQTKGTSLATIADISHLSVKLLREMPWVAKDGSRISELLYQSVLKQTYCTETNKADKSVHIYIPVLPAEGSIGHVLHIEFKEESALHGFINNKHAMFDVFGNLLKLFDKLERDTLTGFFNGNSLEKSLHNYCNQAIKSAKESNRNAEQVWITAIRVAQMQNIALERGQRYADEILLNISYFLEKSFRNTDLFFRRSIGDFYVLLPCNDEISARLALERLMANLEKETSTALANHHFHIVYSVIKPELTPMVQLGELVQGLNKLDAVKSRSVIQSINEVRTQT